MCVIRIGQFWRHWRIRILLEAAALVFCYFSTLSANVSGKCCVSFKIKETNIVFVWQLNCRIKVVLIAM